MAARKSAHSLKLADYYMGRDRLHRGELTPELRALEHRFREVVDDMAEVLSYHDFRLIASSPGRYILVADIDAAEEVPEQRFTEVIGELERRVLAVLPEVDYCTFYVTPKFAYS